MLVDFGKIKYLLLLCLFLASTITTIAQSAKDSTRALNSKITDEAMVDSIIKKHSPRKAALRSALVPGWGQYYNKKYWKLPFVYGALGTTGYIFFYNIKEYKLLRKAFIYRTDTIIANNALIDPRFTNLSNESIRSYRNTFRQNVDYSVLVFLIFWGLNVVDATVDAHLKAFDVSDDLTLKFSPGYSDLGKTTGLSLIFKLNNKPRNSIQHHIIK